MEKNLAMNEDCNFSLHMKPPHNEKINYNKLLQKSKETFHGILEAIDEGYFEIDLNGNITYCNNAASAILGYPHDMLITMNNRDISTVNSFKRMSAAFKEIFQTGLASHLPNYEITRGDGNTATVELSAGLMTDLDAEPTGFHGIIRRAPRETTSDTELLLKSYAVEKSIIAIAIINPGGNFSYVNNAFLRMWCHDERSGITGTSFPDSFHPDDRENINEMLDTLDELGSWVGELSLKKKDGSTFFVILSASIIRNELDKDIGTIVSFVDISLRKKIDVALKENQQNLSKRNEFMAREMRIAKRTVKDIISTNLPRIDSLLIDFRHRPMNEIGGDFFSVYPYGRDMTGVFICDISGHGVASSLYLSLLKSIADNLSVTYGRTPVEYLTRLNQDLVGRISSYFITGIYGLFTRAPQTNQVMFSFANGGHPGPILVSKDGRIKLHSMKSTLIGISNDVSFNSSTITLETGDRLFLYTDGIPETANRSRTMIGYDYHLLDLFTKSSHYALGENLDAIIDKVDAFREGGEVTDDILIIGFEAEK
jgi:phosphoserine phosphatase RsbU/P